jgi:5-formyltetrahydrofolate cyclo-ligase
MQDVKKQLRASALKVRKEVFGQQGAMASAAVAVHGLTFLEPGLQQGAIVSGFCAIRDEFDPDHLIERLNGDGYQIAMPVMQGKDQPLVFRAWAPGDSMATALWGIQEPLPDQPVLDPDIVLVPLLAYDAQGHRLGYGGGFYDRTLARLRAIKPIIAIGIAYGEQMVDAVPHSDYDQRLDWVLTPSGPMKF